MKDSEYLIKVGKNIRKYRTIKGMSQTDLAYACEFEKQNMNRIESGKNNLTLKSLRKIASALNVTISELIEID